MTKDNLLVFVYTIARYFSHYNNFQVRTGASLKFSVPQNSYGPATAAARSPKLFVAAPPSLLASESVSVARRTSGPPPSSPSISVPCLRFARVLEIPREDRKRKKERETSAVGSRRAAKGRSERRKMKREGPAPSREINLIFKQI